MPKGYFLSAHRSPADPEKRQAYLNLAGPAILKSNGKILASTNDVDAHENGVSEQTVLVEFESLEKVKEFYPNIFLNNLYIVFYIFQIFSSKEFTYQNIC